MEGSGSATIKARREDIKLAMISMLYWVNSYVSQPDSFLKVVIFINDIYIILKPS